MALHMFIWFVGVLEIWVGLSLIGAPRSLGAAIAIETVGHAVKAAGFLIPGAWGVQEGGYIALCAAFGISSPTAIALAWICEAHSRFRLLCAPGLWVGGEIEPRRKGAPKRGGPSGWRLIAAPWPRSARN